MTGVQNLNTSPRGDDMGYECDNDNHDIGCQCPGLPGMTWEYGIQFDKVPTSPDMRTGSAPQTQILWLKSLDDAQRAKRSRAPLSATNHTVVARLVGPVKVYLQENE